MQYLYGFPTLAPMAIAIDVLRTRLALARDDESGYTTETIIITALLAACALALVTALVVKITTTAGGIKTDNSGTP